VSEQTSKEGIEKIEELSKELERVSLRESVQVFKELEEAAERLPEIKKEE